MKNKRGQMQPISTTTTTQPVATLAQPGAPVVKKSSLPIWIASGIVAIVAIVALIYFL